MTSTGVDGLIDSYLRSLDDALSGLPPARRQRLVSEIAEHLDEARSQLPDQSEPYASSWTASGDRRTSQRRRRTLTRAHHRGECDASGTRRSRGWSWRWRWVLVWPSHSLTPDIALLSPRLLQA